ncbi:MAG: type II secretion system F family protein [Thermoplasmata archaeon]|nr:type II secretion system F family protein [Thermoplasmata archaeon]
MFEPAEAAQGVQTPTDTTTKPKSGSDSAFLKRYRSFCYRVLGERLDRSMPGELLAERLKQAGLNITPGLHFAEMIVSAAIAGVVAFVVGLVLFGLLIHVPLWYLYVLVPTGVAGGATCLAFQSVISSRISNRKGQLERELPFTLSELSVLASTGMSPIELIRKMAGRNHDPVMTSEFQRIVYKSDVQGKDLITAITETAKESPSLSLRETLWDLANMIHQGGNLDEYLRNKSDDILRLKRTTQKEFIERLQTFVDMYVSLVMVGVLMIAVGAFLLNAFGSTAAGLTSDELLLLLTYGLMPVAVAMTSIMIMIAYARAE